MEVRNVAKTNPKPTELAITLAALGHRYSSQGDWLCASQIAANLRLLGFDVKPGALASTLTRMTRRISSAAERRLGTSSITSRPVAGPSLRTAALVSAFCARRVMPDGRTLDAG
jgi:hypothetical protein